MKRWPCCTTLHAARRSSGTHAAGSWLCQVSGCAAPYALYSLRVFPCARLCKSACAALHALVCTCVFASTRLCLSLMRSHQPPGCLELGYTDFRQIRSDPDLDLLRQDPRFEVRRESALCALNSAVARPPTHCLARTEFPLYCCCWL